MFSLILRNLRKANHITQRHLANELFVDCSTVTKWETGKAIPSSETLNKIANIFGVSVDYLLGREAGNKEKPVASDELSNKNVKFIGRDGQVKFKKLTPEMISMLEQLPDSDEDL